MQISTLSLPVLYSNIARLETLDDGCELQLDSAAYISNSSPVNEEIGRCSVLELPEDFDSSMPNSNNFHDIGICPTFSTFTFTGWSLEQEERLMEDGKVELEKVK
jgi:hypothetical protein